MLTIGKTRWIFMISFMWMLRNILLAAFAAIVG